MTESSNAVSIESRYRLLKLIGENPGMSQRDLAIAMGISLGKANYCLRALIDLGLIKIENFRNSRNKAGYLYKLTPKGITAKAKSTQQFLRRKLEEYKNLEIEIKMLRQEMATRDLIDNPGSDPH